VTIPLEKGLQFLASNEFTSNFFFDVINARVIIAVGSLEPFSPFFKEDIMGCIVPGVPKIDGF